MKEIEWSDEAISDMAVIEKPSARRIRAALERFAQSGSGDIKKLQGFDRLSFAFAPVTFAFASISTSRPSAFFASLTAKMLTAEFI